MKKILLFFTACSMMLAANAETSTSTLLSATDVSIEEKGAWTGWFTSYYNEEGVAVTQEAFLEVTFNNTTSSGYTFNVVVQSTTSTQDQKSCKVDKAGKVCYIPLTVSDIKQVALQNTVDIATDYSENITIKLVSGLVYEETSTDLTIQSDTSLSTSAISELNDYDKVVITFDASSDWTESNIGWTQGTINGIDLPSNSATGNNVTLYAIELKNADNLKFNFWNNGGSDATNAELKSVKVYPLQGNIDSRNKIVLTENSTFNYQSSGINLELEAAPSIGDTVVFTLTNVNVSEDIPENLQVFLIEQGDDNEWAWNVVSNYSIIESLATAKATDAAVTTVTVKVLIENAITYPSIVSAYFATTTAPVSGTETISILYENMNTEVITGVPTAVEDIANSNFAVEGGMVYSEGNITVYNVVGEVVAFASQAFNVNTLNAGVYFISAQEGIIKFVK